MARPTKWRKIEHIPAIPYFVPSDKELDVVPENILKLEELEAIRLKDLEGLEQEECAKKMEVSRPTFQRILLTAREKIADSLIHGKTIHIEGGNYTRNICSIKCITCGREWNESYEKLEKVQNEEYNCPRCGSAKVACEKNSRNKYCNGACPRHHMDYFNK